MKLNNRQIIFITLLGAYMVFAGIMLIVVSNKEHVDELKLIMWAGSIIGAAMTIIGLVLKSLLSNRPVTLMQPNGRMPNSLGSSLGIGNHLFGGIRFREAEDTWVSYTFFLLFIFPLFPTGCYRVRLLNSEYSGRSLKNEWAIYGSEKSNALEIITVYLNMYGLLLWLCCMILSIILTFI